MWVSAHNIQKYTKFMNVDIRELIQVDDVMEDKDLKFGPNGGLVFCMEYDIICNIIVCYLSMVVMVTGT